MELAKLYGLVCVVINKEGKILLLKRAPDKKYYPERWATVAAGPISPDTDFDSFAKKEVKAETGQEGKMLESKEQIVFEDQFDGKLAELHIKPYLFEVDSENIILNDEHTEYKWVNKEDLLNYDLVPEGAKIINSFLNR